MDFTTEPTGMFYHNLAEYNSKMLARMKRTILSNASKLMRKYPPRMIYVTVRDDYYERHLKDGTRETVV